jgi:hypothetical protein
LLARDPATAAAQREVLRTRQGREGPALETETMRYGPLIEALTRSERHALIELLSPALHELSPAQRSGFLRALEVLIEVDQRLSVFEHVLISVLRDRLSPDKKPHTRAEVRHHSLKAVRTELSLALSLLSHAGSSEASAREHAFAAGAARLPELQLSALPPNEHMLLGLDQALAALRALAPKLRAQVIDAAAHTALADERMLDDEASLLALFCDALECPLPPWADGR